MGVLDRARQAATQAAAQAADQARRVPEAGLRGGAAQPTAAPAWAADAQAASGGAEPSATRAVDDQPAAAASWPPTSAPGGAAPASAGAAPAAPQAVDWSQLGAQMRDVAGKAKGGLATVLDRVDPGMLADLIVRATSIQEGTNRALRGRGSLYRIGEVTITATIPPQIGFSIQRIGDLDGDGVPDILEERLADA